MTEATPERRPLAEPAVSVVIPTHNRPEMLGDAIDSVLAQTFQDLEVVVVDDGSVPAVELPERFASAPVRVVRHERALGVCAARNRGIDEARGRWVALLDDDDRWLPTKLERQVAAMGSGARWSFTGCNAVRADGSEVVPFKVGDITIAAADIERNNRIGTPSSVVAERSLLLEAGGFSTELAVLADWDMWIRLARLAPAAPIDEPLIDYVIHDGGMHRKNVEAGLRERKVMAQRYGLGRRLGGMTYWAWVARSLRGSGRPVAATAVSAYVVARFPRHVARRLLGRAPAV